MQANYDAILQELYTKVISIQEINEKNMWELFSNKEGYIVYTKTNPDNGIKINRTQTEIAHKPEVIANVVWDVKKRQLYDEKVETAQIVESIDNNTQIVYVRVKPPAILMSSRDLVLLQRIFKNQDGSIVIIAKSIIHQNQPPVHKVERAEMSLAGWILTPQANGMTKIVSLQCLDPKGDVPVAITNQAAKFQSDMVKALCKYVATQGAQKQ
ncbi:hypothetical protein pb186bvf_011297 [Paramecium bursaria]